MSAEDNKKKGNDAFKRNAFDEAVKYYSLAIHQVTDNETLYSNRAASYSALNRHGEALADAEKCIQLKPDWIKGHFRKGVALSKLSRHAEAVQAFDMALKIEPGNQDVMQKLNESRTILKQQTSHADPNKCRDAVECKNTGNTLFKEGQFDKAIQWYTRGIELTDAKPNDDTANCYCNRAACHQQTHNYKQVIADCDSAIAVNSNFSKAYMRRALAFEGLEKWKKAAEDFKKVMELDPGAQAASTGYHRCAKNAKDQGLM